ncbi:hypothetical protein EV714DRAFT_241019 [Schizophyllum commune]
MDLWTVTFGKGVKRAGLSRFRKCDGGRPICGHCLKTPSGHDDCQYPDDGPSQADMLEAQVAVLEDRLAKLQGPGEPVTLHNPHHRSAQHATSPSSTREGRAATMISEPPPQTARVLLNAFVPYSNQLGFFMDRQRFLARISNPMGHPDRPTASLLHAIHLWGARFSRGGVDGYEERHFLAAALHHLPKDLANKRALLDIIQAEVLISFYFLDIGKSVDGPYHSNSAVSLCLGARLNLVHSPDANAASVVDPGTDAERIRAFWTCLVLDNYWSIAHGSPAALESIKIDTPWPEEAFMQARHSRDTVTSWLRGSSPGGTSVLSLNAKATILMQRSSAVITRNRIEPNSRPSNPTVAAELQALDHALQATKAQLLHIDRSRRDALFVVTDALICAGHARLHAPWIKSAKVSSMKCAAAVDSVAKAAHSFRPHEGAWISPIMATLWPLLAELSLKFPEATPDGPFTGRSGAKAILNAMAAHASMEGAMLANYKRLKASIPA